MKTPASMRIRFGGLMIIGLIVCQCASKPVPASVIATRCLDYLIKHDTAHYQRYRVSKSIGEDSTTLIATFTPKPGPDPDEADRGDRWVLSISTLAIVPLLKGRYLVKYYGTDDQGNHYPDWDYLLATSEDGQIAIEPKHAHALNEDNDDLDFTIKLAADGKLIAKTINFGPNDGHCCPTAIGYYALAIKGDSLVKIKQVAASDTL